MSGHFKWSIIHCYRKSPLLKNKINSFKPKIPMSNKTMSTEFKKSESPQLTSKKNSIKSLTNSKAKKILSLKSNRKFNHCFLNLRVYSNNNNKQKNKTHSSLNKLRLPPKIYLSYCLKSNNFRSKKLHFLNKPNSLLLIWRNKCRK